MKMPILQLMSLTTSGNTSYTDIVIDLFNRFGQGDVPGIMERIAENAVWDQGGNPAIIPYSGKYEGKAAVMKFFGDVASSIQITVFEPSNFREEGNTVYNDVHLAGTVLANGNHADYVLHMTWTFDANGNVAYHQAAGDFSGVEAAFLG